MGLVEREIEILRIIGRMIEGGLDFIVVGGYAVSALARHRYSVDCDVVITKEQLEKIEDLLKNEGFTKDIEKSGFDKEYGGEFVSYKKKIRNLIKILEE